MIISVVEFADAEGALNAINTLNETELNGRKIFIKKVIIIKCSFFFICNRIMRTEETIKVENFQEEMIDTLIRIGINLEEVTNIKIEISRGINLEEGTDIKIEREKEREIDIEIVIAIDLGIMKDSLVMKGMEVVKNSEVKKDLDPDPDPDPKKTIKENFRNMGITESPNNVILKFIPLFLIVL